MNIGIGMFQGGGGGSSFSGGDRGPTMPIDIPAFQSDCIFTGWKFTYEVS